MNRGYYFGSRLVIFAAAVLLLSVAVNPTIRWKIVRTGQGLTGAQVDVGNVSTSYKHALVVMDNFQAADPDRPMRNLFEADRIELQLDPTALARKKFIVERGLVTGFRVGTERSSSGSLTAKEREQNRIDLTKRFSEFGEPWFDRAGQLMEDDIAQGFQSIDLAQELSRRWPTEFTAMTDEAKRVKDRIAQMRHFLEDSGDNPLRNIETYQQAVSDLESLRHQLVEVRRRLSVMEQQMEMDRQAMARAKDHDERMVRAPLEMSPFAADPLSEYLLGPELGSRMVTVIDWLRWGRRRLPANSSNNSAQRRGEEILFPGMQAVPDVLLRTVVLRGEGTFGGEQMAIEGIIKRLSTRPDLVSEPTEITLQTVDGPSMLVHAVLDSCGDIGHDEVVVDLPQLAVPASILGNPDRLALTVAAGRVHLWMKVRLAGDRLDGDLVIKRENPKLAALLPQGHANVARLVNDAAGGITRLEAKVALAGTIHAPQWRLTSNLGSELAATLERSVSDVIMAKRDGALRLAHQDVDTTFGALQETFTKQSEWATKELAVGATEIDRVQQVIASRVGRPDGVIDKNSPLRETFRR